jgi:AraC-like DNA-binding protein
MVLLETAIRGGAIALFLLLAACAVPKARKCAAARYNLMFALCGVAYLIVAAPGLASRSDPWLLPVRIFSLATPAVFWLWTAAHFDDEFEPAWWRWLVWLGLIVLGAWAELVQRRYGWYVVHLASILVIGLGIGEVLAGRRTDLVESRRALRVALAIGTAALLAGFSTVEFAAYGNPGVMVAAIIAAAMAATAFIFILMRPAFGADTPNPTSRVAEPRLIVPASPTAAPMPDAPPPEADEAVWLERLRIVMEHDKAYREEGLSIRNLAERLHLPEYRLRRLINQRLGHRNFSTYVNGYRLAETTGALADPSQAQVPILTIALDAGFQSIGPFNRAFKAHTGMTPSEYRRAHLDATERRAAE